MHLTKRLRLMTGLLCAAGVISGCKDDSTGVATARSIEGPAVSVGNGTARTVVTMSGDKPLSLGIELSDGVLQNLPSSNAEWQLALPSGVAVAPFDHATLNWNVQGHPPPGIYTVPHFDFHFYMITPQQQQAVPGGPVTPSLPAVDIPADYAPDPVTVPDMGLHWTDTQSPEFHGQPFQRTFIYGSYQGQLTFLEPMITLAYLQTHPDAELTVKQPASVQRPGVYPTHYSVTYDASKSMLHVSLDSLISRS